MSTFWSQMAVEPKRQHRWYVTFGANNGGLQQLRFAAKKVGKPKAKINSTPHKYLNHTFNFPGRLEWEDITIDFASVALPDATGLVEFITQAAGYILPITEFDVETISKQKFEAAIGDVNIIQIDAEGNPIETWTLYRSQFTSISYGELDYENEGILAISIGIKYDWASLNGNRGNGQPVTI